MIKKISKKFKKVNSQKGFTLLEILVVLTIMGFLIAMVAPRLAGISGSAVDTVCDSNQNRMVTYMSSYYEQTNGYPNKLTNLVMQDSGAAPGADYQIPVVSDQDPENGAEVFANELYSRNHFYIHYLDADEAAELKDMGIITVFNLNDYSQIVDAVANPANYLNNVPHAAVGTQEASMDPVTPVLNVGVAMVGCGIDNTGVWDSATEERGWGEPGNFARIVLGMGTECGLITSGVISNAAHCPGGIQNDDNVTYNDYILLLPRLAATTARMPAMPAAIGNIADPEELVCAAYDEDADLGAAGTYVLKAAGGNTELLKIREFDITEAQEGWQFATMCPEGHMYPADDEEFWAVDISDNDSI